MNHIGLEASKGPRTGNLKGPILCLHGRSLKSLASRSEALLASAAWCAVASVET